MTTYYISPSGDDLNSGTSTGSPFATFAKAVSVVAAGDTISLLKNASHLTTVNLDGWPSGVSGSPITINGYGSGSPPVIRKTTSGGRIIDLSNAAYLIFEELTIDQLYSTGGVSPASHIYIGGTANNLQFHDCVIRDTLDDMVDFTGSSSSMTEILFSGGSYSASNYTGLSGEANDVFSITNPNATNITFENLTAFEIDHTPFVIKGGTNITIDNVIVYDIGGKAIGVGSANGVSDPTGNITVKNSQFYRIGSREDVSNDEAKPHGIIDIGSVRSGEYVRFYNNRLYKCDASAVVVRTDNPGDVEVDNNTLIGWGYDYYDRNTQPMAAFEISTGTNGTLSPTVRFANNLCIGTKNNLDYARSGSEHYYIFARPNNDNNLAIANNHYYGLPMHTSESTVTESFKAGSPKYTSITSYIASGYETSPQQGDPLLSNLPSSNAPYSALDLRINSASSPLVDAANATYAPSTDWRGATRPASPDIGAYEFGAGSIEAVATLAGTSGLSATGKVITSGAAVLSGSGSMLVTITNVLGQATLSASGAMIARGIVATPIAKQVAASDDDADETPGGTVDLTRHYIRLEVLDGWLAAKFDNIALAQGAQIFSAILELYVYDASFDDLEATFYAEDANDAAAFTSTANDIEDRPRTTASTTISASSIASGGATWYSVDVTTAIQEVLDRGGWVSSNDVAIIAKANSGSTFRARSYDNSSSLAPKLTIITKENIKYGRAILGGTGSLTASAMLRRLAQATLSGTGSLTADGMGVRKQNNALLTGIGGLTAIGSVIARGGSEISGAGSLTATGTVTTSGQATLSGVGALSLDVTIIIDDRVFIVVLENRNFSVRAEDRTFRVDANNRTFVVNKE